MHVIIQSLAKEEDGKILIQRDEESKENQPKESTQSTHQTMGKINYKLFSFCVASYKTPTLILIFSCRKRQQYSLVWCKK